LPAPAPAPVQEQAPFRPGGDIRQPSKVKDLAPVYPALARTARVEGLVIIEATIGTDGRVRDARVLRSIPLLDAAALEAVRGWEYTPTRLNGVPIAIVMTVTVNFRLR
jgi:periplasmic protein TonB